MFRRLVSGVVVHECERQRGRWRHGHAEHQLRQDEQRHGSYVELRHSIPSFSSAAALARRRRVHAVTDVVPIVMQYFIRNFVGIKIS